MRGRESEKERRRERQEGDKKRGLGLEGGRGREARRHSREVKTMKTPH